MRSIIETHPHLPFVPKNASCLIVGSFPGQNHSNADGKYEWFYESSRNQFWKILRAVYQLPLITLIEKKDCFAEKGIAIADLFLRIKRKNKTNSDSDLEVIETNDKALQKIILIPTLEKIFFTSRFVEQQFVKLFPEVTIGESLPSPSPRNARMSLEDKIKIYREKLPK